MKNPLSVLAVVCGLSAFAGVGTMTSAPLWDLADHGGRRAVSSSDPLVIEKEAIPNQLAFTVEATFTFDTYTDYAGFTLLDQQQSETGWGLRCKYHSTGGNPVMLACNGELYGVSYGMGDVLPGSTHSFIVTVRKGWMVVYMDGKFQRSFAMTPVPNLVPITVGAPCGDWTELTGVTLEGLRIWDENEEYYAVGEDQNPATGFKGGVGWLCEVPMHLNGGPNVLLVGDSISDGYAPLFKSCTDGKANVYHWTYSFNDPGAAGVPTNKIDEVSSLTNFDIVVFNNGLHSLHWTEDRVTDEAAKESYATLVDCFRAASPQATVYCLGTTPYTAPKDPTLGYVNDFGECNPVVLRLNALAQDVAAEKNAGYIDAYLLLSTQLHNARGDQYHWNNAAYECLARLVAQEVGIVKVWKGDWNDFASGEAVSLPKGDYVIGDNDITVVNRFDSIFLEDSETRLVFRVTTNSVLSCGVSGLGEMRKECGSSLTLAVPASFTDYKCYNFSVANMTVAAGELVCPQDKDRYFYLGHVDVAEGAVLKTARTSSGGASTTLVAGLTGMGMVTNLNTSGSAILLFNGIAGGPYVFDGVIAGGIRVINEGSQYLTFAENAFPGEIQSDNASVGAVLGIGTFGSYYQKSSVGTWNGIRLKDRGGAVRYLGTGENTNRKLYYNNPSGEEPHTVDGGANGGLVFQESSGFGNWEHQGGKAEEIVLTGDNANPCVLQNGIVGDTTDAPTRITKRGSGTWRFEDHPSRQNAGVIAVENGVLQFTSIAEAGTVCSLGLSTALGAEGYAYLLGSDAARGTLEYVGGANASVTTRPIAVRGVGEIRNSAESGGSLSVSNVFAAANGSTLVLGGGVGPGASLSGVGDGAGTLGLVKEGAGTWALDGVQSFSGPVEVKQGVLKVNGSHTKRYTWFKFVIRGDEGADYVRFYGLEFYDADGVPQLTAENMRFLGYTPRANNWHADANDWSDIQPGQYGWARSGAYIPMIGNESEYEISDNDIGGIFNLAYWCDVSTAKVRVSLGALDPDDESTWWPILIRIPEGVNPIAAYDVVGQNSSRINHWTLMGSEDGIAWDELHRYDEADASKLPGQRYWYSNPEERYSSSARTRKGKGFWILPEPVADYHPLANVSGVVVASGATLQAAGSVVLPALDLDCANGNGTIAGCDFALGGVVNLTNLPGAGNVAGTVRFEDLPTGALQRLNDRTAWRVLVNGTARPELEVEIRGDGFSVVRPGMAMYLK